MRQHKEDQERLHARVAAVEAELVAGGRPPVKQISVLPSSSGYQPQQRQKDLGGKCGHGKIMNGEGGKWSRQKFMEEEYNKRPEPSGKQEDHQ